MHEVLVNRLGGLSLPRKSVVRLTDRPNMTLDVYRGRKTTMQQQSDSHIDNGPGRGGGRGRGKRDKSMAVFFGTESAHYPVIRKLL